MRRQELESDRRPSARRGRDRITLPPERIGARDGMGAKPGRRAPVNGEVIGHIRSRERRRFQKPTAAFSCSSNDSTSRRSESRGAQFGQHGRPLALRPRTTALRYARLQPRQACIARNVAYLSSGALTAD